LYNLVEERGGGERWGKGVKELVVAIRRRGKRRIRKEDAYIMMKGRVAGFVSVNLRV